MADPKKNENVRLLLRSRGYTEPEIQRWMSGPPQGMKAESEKLPIAGKSRTQLAEPAPPSQSGEAVDLREVEHWIAALQHEDVPAELRAVYLRNLQAAIEAAQTPGVTPEDVAYWLHRLRDTSLSAALRATYKRNVREALRRYTLMPEGTR